MTEPTQVVEEQVLERIVANDLATGDEVTAAREQARQRGGTVTSLLVESGLVTDDQVVALRAGVLGLPHVFPYASTLDPNVVGLFSEDLLRRHGALPLAIQDGAMVVAFADDPSPEVRHELEAAVNRPLRPVLAGAERLGRALDAHFGAPRRAPVALRGAVPESTALLLLYGHLVRARGAGATEVRYDLVDGVLVVRYRMGRQLVERERGPGSLLGVVAARAEMLAGRERGASGLAPHATAATITTRLGDRDVVLGLSIVPTLAGPSVLVRLMEASERPRALAPEIVRLGGKGRGLIVVASSDAAAGRRLAAAIAEQANPLQRATVAIFHDPVALDPAVIRLDDRRPAAGALETALRHAADVVVLELAPYEPGAAALVAAAADRALTIVAVAAPDAIEALAVLLEEGASPARVARVLTALVTERDGTTSVIDPSPKLRAAIEDVAAPRILRAAAGE